MPPHQPRKAKTSRGQITCQDYWLVNEAAGIQIQIFISFACNQEAKFNQGFCHLWQDLLTISPDFI